jgi:hypothetical protein
MAGLVRQAGNRFIDMGKQDLTNAAEWVARFDGREQYTQVPFGAESPLGDGLLTVMVLCERVPFCRLDREHALQRVEGLRRCLQPSLEAMMGVLGIDRLEAFLTQYGEPTLMLGAGDTLSWSLSFDARDEKNSCSVFCDWIEEQFIGVWLSD